MTLIRGFAAAAALACASLGFACPAQADQVLQGVYTYTPQQGDSGSYRDLAVMCAGGRGSAGGAGTPVACRLHMAPSAEIDRWRRESGRWRLGVELAEERGHAVSRRQLGDHDRDAEGG